MYEEQQWPKYWTLRYSKAISWISSCFPRSRFLASGENASFLCDWRHIRLIDLLYNCNSHQIGIISVIEFSWSDCLRFVSFHSFAFVAVFAERNLVISNYNNLLLLNSIKETESKVQIQRRWVVSCQKWRSVIAAINKVSRDHLKQFLFYLTYLFSFHFPHRRLKYMIEASG